uniref:Transposase n=1 Tax=Candidatus Kentrum sp. MB TaxID=2138164 RepID=A0A450XQ19_9GAMM|nr:MAG: Transposase [Candidatus Kentron sp. MB]VFK34727.1 MAG: Transposase [Candidatus Kentron sp. MB]VFK76909.1 MAG: Transposase [Candidatus Kentron sp. MB]
MKTTSGSTPLSIIYRNPIISSFLPAVRAGMRNRSQTGRRPIPVESLLPFWKRLKHSQTKIEAVATDMGLAYIKAVTENLPEAVLVFDYFHIIKLYNEKLAALRRDIAREADILEKSSQRDAFALHESKYALVG